MSYKKYYSRVEILDNHMYNATVYVVLYFFEYVDTILGSKRVRKHLHSYICSQQRASATRIYICNVTDKWLFIGDQLLCYLSI